jgi:hypothetical protein
MSDDIKNEIQDIIDNVINIDEGRVKRLKERGHYFTLLEQFDVLRIKFIYDQLDKDEARNFVTLCKYFKDNGHSESLRLTCHYIHKKYIEKQGL